MQLKGFVSLSALDQEDSTIFRGYLTSPVSNRLFLRWLCAHEVHIEDLIIPQVIPVILQVGCHYLFHSQHFKAKYYYSECIFTLYPKALKALLVRPFLGG